MLNAKAYLSGLPPFGGVNTKPAPEPHFEEDPYVRSSQSSSSFMTFTIDAASSMGGPVDSTI